MVVWEVGLCAWVLLMGLLLVAVWWGFVEAGAHGAVVFGGVGMGVALGKEAVDACWCCS